MFIQKYHTVKNQYGFYIVIFYLFYTLLPSPIKLVCLKACEQTNPNRTQVTSSENPFQRVSKHYFYDIVLPVTVILPPKYKYPLTMGVLELPFDEGRVFCNLLRNMIRVMNKEYGEMVCKYVLNMTLQDKKYFTKIIISIFGKEYNIHSNIDNVNHVIFHMAPKIYFGEIKSFHNFLMPLLENLKHQEYKKRVSLEALDIYSNERAKFLNFIIPFLQESISSKERYLIIHKSFKMSPEDKKAVLIFKERTKSRYDELLSLLISGICIPSFPK